MAPAKLAATKLPHAIFQGRLCNFSDREAKCVLHCPLLARSLPSPHLNQESALAKPPNYKQEKKRREDMQKKKNEAKQREQAARKENAPPPPKP
jgi:hypothetical protein